VSTSAPGLFTCHGIDEVVAFFDLSGYATLWGVIDQSALMGAEEQLVEVQRRLAERTLTARASNDAPVEKALV
jgi:hypothetical protein